MFILIFLLLMIQVVEADVYVITAPDKSVFSLSEQDDAVVPDGYKKNIVKNKMIKDLTFSMGEEKLYDFNGGSFTLNSKKVQDKNKEINDAILLDQTRESDKISAINKLKVLGLTDAEISALTGR